MFRRSLQCAKDTAARDRRRVAGFSQQAGDVISFPAYELHISGTRTDILSGDVPTVERVNETSVRAKDPFAVNLAGGTQHDRFTAAKWNSGQRVLVSHATREAQQVLNSRFIVLIFPE